MFRCLTAASWALVGDIFGKGSWSIYGTGTATWLVSNDYIGFCYFKYIHYVDYYIIRGNLYPEPCSIYSSATLRRKGPSMRPIGGPSGRFEYGTALNGLYQHASSRRMVGTAKVRTLIILHLYMDVCRSWRCSCLIRASDHSCLRLAHWQSDSLWMPLPAMAIIGKACRPESVRHGWNRTHIQSLL